MRYKQNLLVEAARNGNLKRIQFLLLDHSAYLLFINAAFIAAIQNNHIDCVDYFLKLDYIDVELNDYEYLKIAIHVRNDEIIYKICDRIKNKSVLLKFYEHTRNSIYLDIFASYAKTPITDDDSIQVYDGKGLCI